MRENATTVSNTGKDLPRVFIDQKCLLQLDCRCYSANLSRNKTFSRKNRASGPCTGCDKIRAMKFLHIADVHLGCTRYQLPESPRDFFDAWFDVLQRYAIGEKVDFVIMCGDFFHKRVVPPETMNYAVEGLTAMREAGIPVVAIEGNH